CLLSLHDALTISRSTSCWPRSLAPDASCRERPAASSVPAQAGGGGRRCLPRNRAALMQLAFVLYKYFPFGGLQRDFLRIALECQRRGHGIRVYTPIWEGEVPAGFDVRVAPVKALFNHRRNEKFSAWLAADLARDPVDRVVGFNKMPGLDVYYAADGCYEDKAQTL